MVDRIRKALDERDQGFTLIELLVVIIIIGILAAIAIPVFLNQRKKGVDAGLKSDLKNAATSVETWATDNPSTAVPAGLSKGSGTAATPAAVASAALTDFKPSAGNFVELSVPTGYSTGEYCLSAWNPGASSTGNSTTARQVYSSKLGGMQPASVNAC